MSHESFRPARRRWLKLGSLAAVCIATASRAGAAFAQAPPLKRERPKLTREVHKEDALQLVEFRKRRRRDTVQ
jgi:hypothetical protein